MLLSTLAAGGAAAGCGSDDGVVTAPATTAAASVPALTPAPAPTATATTPGATSPAATTPTATTGVPTQEGQQGTGETGPGGGGDEEAARVPAAFAVSAGAISPARITLPAFLTIALSVTAQRAPATVTLALPSGQRTLRIAAGGTARRRLTGLRPGDYAVTVAGGSHAVLHVVAGGAPGP